MPRTYQMPTVEGKLEKWLYVSWCLPRENILLYVVFSSVAFVSCSSETVQLQPFIRANGVTFFEFFFQIIPDKRVGTMLITRWFFSLFDGKNAIFSNFDQGGWGMRDTAQVSPLFLAGIAAVERGQLFEALTTRLISLWTRLRYLSLQY